MKKAVCLLITTAIICHPVQVVAEEFTNQNKYSIININIKI